MKDPDFTNPEDVLKWKSERYIYTAQRAGIEAAKDHERADRIARAMRLLRAWEALPWGLQGNVAHMKDLMRAVDGTALSHYGMLRVEQNERIRERLEQILRESGTCDCEEPNHNCRCCNAWMALAFIEDALTDKDEDHH